MLNQELLNEAMDKFNNRNVVSNEDYRLSLNNFILKIYKCDPASYGTHIQRKIIQELDILCNEMGTTSDQGDFLISYPHINNDQLTYYTWNGYEDTLRYNKENLDLIKTLTKYGEVKSSYLSPSNKSFNIKNVRPWQDIDFYLICFIDCENDFKPEFYCVKSKDLYSNFKMSDTNGSTENNKGNEFIHKSINIKKNSEKHDLLKSINKLDGNDFEHLIEYFYKIKCELRDQFYKPDTLSKILDNWVLTNKRSLELFHMCNKIMDYRNWEGRFIKNSDEHNKLRDEYNIRVNAKKGFLVLKDYGDVKKGTVFSSWNRVYGLGGITDLKGMKSNDTEYIEVIYFIETEDSNLVKQVA